MVLLLLYLESIYGKKKISLDLCTLRSSSDLCTLAFVLGLVQFAFVIGCVHSVSEKDNLRSPLIYFLQK